MAEGFGSAFWGSFTGGIVTAALVAAVGIGFSESVAETTGYLNPTCENPRGLKPIPTTDVTAEGPTLEATRDKKPLYPAENVLDGYEGSAWMPPIAPVKDRPTKFSPVFVEGDNILTLTLAGSGRKIELVCVNNALGAGEFRYTNWGKARTVVFWTGDQGAGQGKVTVLQALPLDESQQTQEVADNVGVATRLKIQLIDAYSGSAATTDDPDLCVGVMSEEERKQYRSVGNVQETLASPCIVAATPYAGLSEVAIYEIDPNDSPPIWLPFR